ncbi:MAG: 3-phosphoshikimate 1-carboxyvinyltransferase [Bacteroidetes bacterium]|nr:3-phosphoshikimate 1-carboxyvinyltransferase [Bacteroidota bacterium]
MFLKATHQSIRATVQLPGSKSISNRWLILKEVLKLNNTLNNLSTAEDTQDLIKAIRQFHEGTNKTIDIGHAGTDMRFLTAFLSTQQGEWILTGSQRMKERPIKELVNALKLLGAEIYYLENEGYPPLKIIGKELKENKTEINAGVSSQFISALLLIAPGFSNGFEITLTGNSVSWSYILMTIHLLEQAGFKVDHTSRQISVKPTAAPFPGFNVYVEPDWSSASYWYSIVALTNLAEITLPGLHLPSLQGDSALTDIYKNFGVSSEFVNGNLVLSKKMGNTSFFEYDFKNCPDIAQTVAVTCLGLKIDCKLTGLSTLKHKETDRLSAMKTELEKFDALVNITSDSLELKNTPQKDPKEQIQVQTYNDHRIAMSFAPLALWYDNIDIIEPEVVKKSYPEFWSHLKTVGISGS